jgi:hypothetical protein
MNTEIIELINRRRHQVIIHATLYYKLNETLWSDEKYDQAVRELVKLQREHPQEAEKAKFHKEFLEWDDGSECPSAFGLGPIGAPWTLKMCQSLLDYKRSND